MMKKMYNQPEVLISEMMPNTIICASITDGGNTGDHQNPGDIIIGD